MKIAVKYGLLITSVVIVWVVITRFLFPINVDSSANLLAPIIFNLAAIIAIYLGITTRAGESGGRLSFKEGLKTGVWISAVYGASSSLFFFVLILIVGPELMGGEPMAHSRPLWQAALLAYVGLFFGALFLGLVYSAFISFILVRSQKTGAGGRGKGKEQGQ